MPSLPVNPEDSRGFWRDVFAWSGSVTPIVLPRVFGFAAFAFAVGVVHSRFDWESLEAGPVQFTGGALALLLVLRTNAGYERWWEGRKLWGGLVNQSRNLAVAALAYGPADRAWRERYVRLVAAFAHATRRALRGESDAPEVVRLLGSAEGQRILESQHRPLAVAQRLAQLLQEAADAHALEGFALLAAERERAGLLDHAGGCERILKTPLPLVHSIKLRRFIVIYLVALPFALGPGALFSALVTALVAYPLLAIDQIGIELQHPFSPERLSHLPLEVLCHTIETNVLALLEQAESAREQPHPQRERLDEERPDDRR